MSAKSRSTRGEYGMPEPGAIFLRRATNRYRATRQAIEADQAAGLGQGSNTA